MAYLSAQSIKKYNPEASVILFTDGDTHLKLKSTVPAFLNYYDEVRHVQLSAADPKARSRELKTTLRRRISGDYLFVDTDTVVVGSLESLWNTQCIIALTGDHHFPVSWHPPFEEKLFNEMNWKFPPSHYFNTGVMLVRDCRETHALYECWHHKWHSRTNKIQIYEDQGAFSAAVEETGVVPTVLSYDYNHMIKTVPRLKKSTRIIHYFGTQEKYSPFLIFSPLLEQVSKFEPVDWSLLENSIKQQHCWHTPVPWQLWASGHYAQAILGKLRQIITFRQAN